MQQSPRLGLPQLDQPIIAGAGNDLTAHEIAQIHFGAEINGLAQMTVGNLLEEAASYGAQGLAQELDGLGDPIKEGLVALADTVDNRLENLLQEALDNAISATVVEPLIDALYAMEQADPNWDAKSVCDARYRCG